MSTQHIENCIIDGGNSLPIICPEDDCEADSTAEATIWNPRNILGLSEDTKTVSERLVAVQDQVLFKVTTFDYVPGTGALDIHKNGLLLTPGVDWAEQGINQFQLVVPATVGDQIVAQGHVGIIANIDVRDTDIYVNNYQEVRDYAGTEILLFALGRVTLADGGEGHFIYTDGFAIGFFVDNNTTIIVPTGGDGSAAWVRKAQGVYQTLNDLIVSPSVSVGDVVQTFGYLTAGDAGGNVYSIVAAGTGTDDGGQFIDLTGTTFQAQGLFDAAPYDYNVRQWGAVGDGIVDDTVQIQRAINHLSTLGGGTVKFPLTTGGSDFLCNVIIGDNVSLEGVSRDVSLVPALDAAIITVSATTPINRLTIKLLNLWGIGYSGGFTSTIGILVQPNTTIVQDKINIEEVVIESMMDAGIVLSADAVDSEIREAVIYRSTIRNCPNSGLLIEGKVTTLKVASTTIKDNGDENTVADSNIVIQVVTPGFGQIPQDIAFDTCRIENNNYLVTGASVAVTAVVGLSFSDCTFLDFYTAFLITAGVNGQIIIRDSRFERDPGLGTPAIESVVELVNVNGFTWENNNIASTTTGPVGILYNGLVDDIIKVDIGGNNSWGGLTRSVSDLPPVIASPAGIIELPTRNGTVPLNLVGPGIEDLFNIYDEKGGVAQLVDGDEILLHIIDVGSTVNVDHGGGNINLHDGIDCWLQATTDFLKLSWSGYLQEWVEIARSNNAL